MPCGLKKEKERPGNESSQAYEGTRSNGGDAASGAGEEFALLRLVPFG